MPYMRENGKKLDPQEADAWSAEEVIRRWIIAYPPKTLRGEEIEINQAWIDFHAKDEKRGAVLRERLRNLSWFMKSLKESLARLANKEDRCRGVFWESRYRSVAILDNEALLATCAYIDLNPVAAGIAAAPNDRAGMNAGAAKLAVAANDPLRKCRRVAVRFFPIGLLLFTTGSV